MINLVLIESTLREPQDDSSFYDERKAFVMLRRLACTEFIEVKHDETGFNRIHPS